MGRFIEAHVLTGPEGCGYEGHEFGARYLDSICGGGVLWCQDSGAGGDIPCPVCRPEDFLVYSSPDQEEAV